MAGRKFEEESPEVGSGQMVSVSMHVRNERVGGVTQSWGSDQSLGMYTVSVPTQTSIRLVVCEAISEDWITGIQSRAYGLNIEFHIELRFKKKLTVVAALDSS